ncbi:MAG: NAD(P)-dependent oxidoreductase [Spirochaetes bacterium]|nr:NAD(P)-dependent oxidoreductase [Spirochaetota bacterium]
MLLYEDLCALDRPIRVGLVGAGFMGKGIVEAVEYAPGMEVVAVCDKDLSRAAGCFEAIGVSGYREVKDAAGANRVSFEKERVITSDYRVIGEVDGIDMVIEATGVPSIGAEVAFKSIMNQKHVGMLNVETDVTCGYYLSRIAEKSGVVYTVCSGDEPAAVRELVDFARTTGFTVVACGKGKNNPLDRAATPDTLSERAAAMKLNPRILTEFVDGTKTMVEMCAAANACGLTVDIPDMNGPAVDLEDIARVFRPKKDGGILTREGVVDYVIGDLAPGIFCVVRHEGAVANETLRYLKVGEGPNFLLYRPYHLTNLEVPVTIGTACLHKRPVLQTNTPPLTETTVAAKRDLEAGDTIDGIGGFLVRGGIRDAGEAREKRLLPLGLVQGAVLKRDVEKGECLSYGDVELPDTVLFHLRRLQDTIAQE